MIFDRQVSFHLQFCQAIFAKLISHVLHRHFYCEEDLSTLRLFVSSLLYLCDTLIQPILSLQVSVLTPHSCHWQYQARH
jgi:hypothetical protein